LCIIVLIAGGIIKVEIVWVLVGSSILVLIFLILWLRERRRAQTEYIAYGLRTDEDSDENMKTNITQMESRFVDAISKLEELDEVQQDDWGHWIWTKTGKPVGNSVGKS
jgi:hypothetical protein